jgi:hypothetical protein
MVKAPFFALSRHFSILVERCSETSTFGSFAQDLAAAADYSDLPVGINYGI